MSYAKTDEMEMTESNKDIEYERLNSGGPLIDFKGFRCNSNISQNEDIEEHPGLD